jgi:subfamily B ATP-binding cassette protein MsbA
MEALERLMEGRTVITIAHRLNAIRDADKIIVLKDGVVAEEGTNDELLSRGGVYAELSRIQSEPALAHDQVSAPRVPFASPFRT